MIIMKNKVNSDTNIVPKRTKSSFFINFLIKICFIPVSVTDENIIFKIFHWRTLIYFILVIGYYFLFYISMKFLKVENPSFKFNTSVEMISVFVEIIDTIIIFLGKTASTLSLILNIITLTEAIESAYKSVKSVKRNIKENLMMTSEKLDRHKLKFLLEDFQSLEPMNA